MRQLNTNRQGAALLLLFILLFAESAIFNDGTVFVAALGLLFMFLGTKKARRFGRFLFWLGVVFLFIAILSLWTLRLAALVIAVLLMIRLWKGETWEQTVPDASDTEPSGPGGRRTGNPSLFYNSLFSAQSTPASAYEWQDVHVQGIAGDLLIDVTQTVLPKRTSLISVRQGFGKVKIIVPYEVPVRIFYTTMYGDVKLFGSPPQRILFSSLQMHDGYTEDVNGQAELLIALATWMGDIEVIRR